MDEEQVQSRTRQEIRKEAEDAEKKFQGFIMRRNEFNDKARQSREDRDLLHQKRKEIMVDVNSLKDAKNKALDELRKHKEKRDILNQKARKIIDLKKAKSGDMKGGNVADELYSLKEQLRKLEYMQQTTPLTMEKERVIIDEIRDGSARLKELEREFTEIVGVKTEVMSLDGEIDTLFREADSEHQLVVKYYTKTKEYRDKLDEIFREVSHLIAEADRKHGHVLEFRKKADDFHQKAMEMREHLTGARNENREQARQARQVIKDQNKAARNAITDKGMLSEKLDEALELWMKKGKISL